jgi:formamidopyrimidine-DNA glycosylase
MPELPEVEHFRQLLLPLISEFPLIIERLSTDKTPPRKFLSPEQINNLSGKCRVTDVLRKGKLLCMVLESSEKTITNHFLFLHMGMTGRISTPDHSLALESLSATAEFPPPHTHLKFRTLEVEVCFSDPRKFGSVQLGSSLDEHKIGFGELAPDALTIEMNHDVLEKLVGQSTGIKPLLLDQKRAMSGVGNWIADEVLYQSQMHPDQNYLTESQAQLLVGTLSKILKAAMSCLKGDERFPEDWLFHRRWSKGKQKTCKDAQGRLVTFVTSGGRTSAIVSSIQKKVARAKPKVTGGTQRGAPSDEKVTTASTHNKPQKRERSLVEKSKSAETEKSCRRKIMSAKESRSPSK